MGEAKQRRLYFEALRKSISARFPTLELVIDRGERAVRGAFVIEHEGRELDRFDIEIDLRQRGPAELPRVKEMAGRLPKEVDRHVNLDGTLCVCLPEQYFMDNPGPFNVMTFLDGPVRDFFLGQALVERGDPWPYGTWDHQEAGQRQWLYEFSRSLTDTQRQAFLTALIEPSPGGATPCPCGRGRQMSQCHESLLLRLRRLLTQVQAEELLSQESEETGKVRRPVSTYQS